MTRDAMLIVCPSCAASYDVAPDKLGAAGRSVRCVRCRNIWFAVAAAAPDGTAAPANTLADGGSAESPARPPASEAAPPGSAQQTPPVSHASGAEKVAAAGESGAGADGESGTSPAGIENPPAADHPPGSGAADGEVSGLPAIIEGASPSLVPALPDEIAVETAPSGGATVEAAANEDFESLAARRARRNAGARKKQQKWRPGLPIVIIVLMIVVAGLIFARKPVVRYLPQTASLFNAIGLTVNVRGIQFENVKTMREMQDGVMVLIVEGTVMNVTPSIVEVPRVRFALRNPAGLEIYAWTAVAGRPVIGPGESTNFSSRLASPPADGREIVVRFLTRRDLVAGGR